MRAILSVMTLSLAFAAPAGAEVTSSSDTSFTVSHKFAVAATPAKAWAALVQPASWWDPAHTYSGDSANLSMDPRAGGCWCEKLAGGGSVEHMRVLFVQPGQAMRLSGGLGPLQAMPVTSVMTFTLKPLAAGTEISVAYAVAGAGGLAQVAAPVDGVLSLQWARLKAAAERPGG